MSKKALAVISFGTTYLQAREAIVRIEDALCAALPEYDLFRAFTSNMVIKKIKREEGLVIANPLVLMQQLVDDGYDEVLCQSLHIMPAIEYEKMLDQLAPFRKKIKIMIGKPMLFCTEDYEYICTKLLESIPKLAEDEAYVYMGHGTEHYANATYSQLENMFRFLGAERVFVGTVEGFPDLSYIRGRLQKHSVHKVTLAPFMIVAGDHAQNDLAGDGEDSWKSVLQADGYKVATDMRGLGDIDAVHDLFIRHALEAKG